MRVVTVMAVLLLGGAATLEAQHRFQFEIGGFASFTRVDPALQLDNQIGGGGRGGLLVTHWVGGGGGGRKGEDTSELPSQAKIVCRLLFLKKKKKNDDK